MKYLALFRGVNVGGKNKLSMAELKECLIILGFKNVSTYINSGNVLFESDKPADIIAREVELALAKSFKFDSDIIKTLVVSKTQLATIVRTAPKNFGSQPEIYHSDVAFLIGVDASDALKAFECNPEVDTVWQGEEVVYYQRLSAKRTKSRLSKIIGKPIYKNITIRSWKTTIKLLELMERE